MAMKITVAEEDIGARHSFEFVALCDGDLCGRITVHRSLRKVSGKVVYKVDRIDVRSDVRRRGVATKLYETAANEACRRRGRLASLERISGAHSTAFWEKQVAKGRAKEVPIRGADRERYTQYLLTDCPKGGADLSRFR